MSFFRRKKEEPQIPPPPSGGYGSSSSYAADDYGADEYSSSAYGRSGGLQPGPTAGRGRSVSPSGYGSQPYGGRNRYDTPDDLSEYSYTSTAVSSRPNVLQKDKPANRSTPIRDDPEKDTADMTRRFADMKRPNDPAAEANKRAQLFAGATVKPSAHPANARSQNSYQGSDEEEFEDEEAIKKATNKTRDETIRVLDETLATGRQVLDTATKVNRRLAEQGEQLGATERHLIGAEGHANRAGDNLDDVKVLNRSIFIPAFTRDKSAKRRAEEEKQQRRYEKGRQAMEQNQAFLRTQQAAGAAANDRDGPPDEDDNNLRYSARTKRYDDDKDDEDELERQKEQTISNQLNGLESMLGRIRTQANGMSVQTQSHIDQLRRTEKRTDELDQNIGIQTAKARRIANS